VEWIVILGLVLFIVLVVLILSMDPVGSALEESGSHVVVGEVNGFGGLAGLLELEFLDIEVLKSSRDGFFRINTAPGHEGQKEQELVEVKSRFHQITVGVVLEVNLGRLEVLILIICLPELVLSVVLILSICDWWQCLFHVFLQRFNIEQTWDEVEVPAHLEETPGNHH
jgi:hypothetical protein